MSAAVEPVRPEHPPQERRRDHRQEVTDHIVSLLEQGTAPWQKPWEPGHELQLPLNPTTGKLYRGGNAIHLMAVGAEREYDDPRWMTYRQAQENGWQVRQGERGAQIEFWDRRGPSTRSSVDRDGQEPTSEDKEPGSPDSRAFRFVHRVYTVFNAAQLDGVPKQEPRRTPEWEVAEAGERILRHSGAGIVHDQGDQAFYHRVSDSIHLPPRAAFRDAAGYYGTALHELAHWSGHPGRLNRPTLNESYRFGDANYAKEELRAELTSVFLAAERGIPHQPERHASYVASWTKALKEDKNEIFRAAQDAHRAADFLLALERERSVDQALASVERPPQRLVEGAVQPSEGHRPGSQDPAASQHRRETSEHVAQHEPGSATVNIVEKNSATERRTPTTNGRAGRATADTHTTTEQIVDGEVGVRQPATAEELAHSFDQAQTLTSQALGDNARLFRAHTDSGIYRGVILGETDHHLVQQLSPRSTVAHEKHLLGDAQLAAGGNVLIRYFNQQTTAKALPERAKGKELGR